MAGVLWIDDVDVSTLGFQVVRTTGLDDAVPLEPATIDLPARGHPIESSVYGIQRPRSVTVRLRFRTSDIAILEAAMHGLRARTLNRVVRLRHAQRPLQEVVVRCLACPVETGKVRWVAPFAWEPTLEFSGIDPHYRDTADQVVGFTTATSVPMGTADSRPRVTLTASGGSVTNPAYTLRNSAGVIVGTVAFAAVLASGDAFEVDAAAGTVRRRISGVWSDARSFLPIGQVIPLLRAADAVWPSSLWPTLERSASVGVANLSGSVTYRRRWL